jgi:hypothetical protein
MSKDVQESELRRIIEAVEIESASTVIFDGQWFTISETERIRSDEKGCHPMVVRLQELLYARCYCRPFQPGRVLPVHCRLDRAFRRGPDAFLDGVSDTSDRLAYVKRSFADFEIRMETPYLNPGSVDHYPPLEDL